MYDSFENTYYTKNLYLTAGRIRSDYNYTIHRNLVRDIPLTRFIHQKITDNSLIACCDTVGRRQVVVFEYFINLYKNTENIFIFKNDLSASDIPLGVYCEKHRKFIVSYTTGIPLGQFYLRTDARAEKTAEIAREFFYKSGDYCQCKNDMI